MWDQGAEEMLSSLCWFWKIGLVLAVIGGTVLTHEKGHDHERDRDQRSLLVNSHVARVSWAVRLVPGKAQGVRRSEVLLTNANILAQ